MTPPPFEAGQAGPDAEVAAWVHAREATPALCMDATRRWFYFDDLGGGGA